MIGECRTFWQGNCDELRPINITVTSKLCLSILEHLTFLSPERSNRDYNQLARSVSTTSSGNG